MNENISFEIEKYIIDNFIEKLPAGTKILSERNLAKHFQVSLPTINKVLVSMTDRGMLIRKKGLGTFIAEKKVERKVIRVITSSAARYDPSKTQNWFVYQLFLEGIILQAQKSNLIIETFIFNHYEPFSEEKLDFLIAPHVDAYVMHVVTQENWVWAKELVARGKKVLTRSAYPSDICHSVSFNNHNAFAQMLCFLIALKKTNIIYLSSEEKSEYSKHNIEEFKNTTKTFGIHWNDDRLFYTGYEVDAGEKIVEKLLKSGVEFNVIIIPHPYKIPGVKNALAKHGLKVPEDVEIVIDDIRNDDNSNQDCSAIGASILSLGSELCNLYNELGNSKDIHTKVISPNFIPRKIN